MSDRSFGGVTSAFWRAEDRPLSLISGGAPRRARSPATPEIFARRPPFFIPEGPFIAVHPASAGARAGFSDFVWRDHVRRLRGGFVNQKARRQPSFLGSSGSETAGNRTEQPLVGRLASLVASSWAQAVSGEFPSESGDGILWRNRTPVPFRREPSD